MTMTENTQQPDLTQCMADERVCGTARTDFERGVEEALASIADWRGREIRYAPVHGGLQNSNWRITVEGIDRRYFLKIPGAGSESFVDRVAANEAAMLAGSLGIAPEMILFDHRTGIEVIEYMEAYRGCTNGDLKRPEIALQIVDLYRTLHSAPLMSLTKTIFDMIDEHLDQAREHGVMLPGDFALIEREYCTAKSALLASGLDLVPCHNDPMPGNFLYSEGHPLKLVDYEFAANNDRAYELAIFVTEMFFDERRTLELIAAFYGSSEWSVVSRVHLFGALADVKWGLWGCINNRLNSGWDFDYHKYGVWKLMRARAKMSDPRWALWLDSV